jgi:hypothetical protein
MAMASRESVDIAGDARADIGLAGHHLGVARLQQYIVESKRLRAGSRLDYSCHGRPWKTV